MNRKLQFIFLGLFTLSCGLINNLLGGGEEGSVSSLWEDVPPFQDAQEANLDLPLPLRLAINTMLRNNFDFIAYTTSQSAQSVQAYYTPELMASQGWQSPEPTCINMEQQSFVKGITGDLCLFYKETSNEQYDALGIILTNDQDSQNTLIYYVRVNFSDLPQITPPAGFDFGPPAETAPALRPGVDLDQIDICQIIPRPLVENLLGRSLVADPKPFSYNGKDTDRGCSYDAGKDADGVAYFAYVVVAPVEDYADNRSEPVEAVSGLGDEAYLVNAADAQQLWVLLNGKTSLMVGIGDQPNLENLRLLMSVLLPVVIIE
jgi:hypothetical protein